jgi:N-acetylmuramoyl-L-alanine amidase
LSAFGDLTLEARLIYSVSGQSGTFTASDTITITVVPIRVMIDPGHGTGSENVGTTGPSIGPNGQRVVPLLERDVVLDIGLMLRDRLAFIGPAPPILVFMTREVDRGLPNDVRADMANREFVDFFVSIHLDGNEDPTLNFTETYYRRTVTTSAPLPIKERSRDYAVLLANEISTEISNQSRGAAERGFTVLVSNDRPAVLTESALLTNPAEQERLRDPAYRGRIADAHKRAIEQGNQLRPRFRDRRNPRY